MSIRFPNADAPNAIGTNVRALALGGSGTTGQSPAAGSVCATMARRLAIVGGDAAGMSAASAARRRDPDLEVVAFERGPYTSYSACGIPDYLGGLFEDSDRLISRSPEEHRARGIGALAMVTKGGGCASGAAARRAHEHSRAAAL